MRKEAALGLPDGQHEVPLLIYDRSFQPNGQLYYPTPPDEGAWAQEFLGDALLVNGKVQPYLNVEPRKYRFRIVNAANSRFFVSHAFQLTGISCRRLGSGPLVSSHSDEACGHWTG